MKTLLLTLLLVPMMSFGQTAEEYFNRGLTYAKSGNYKDAIVCNVSER